MQIAEPPDLDDESGVLVVHGRARGNDTIERGHDLDAVGANVRAAKRGIRRARGPEHASIIVELREPSGSAARRVPGKLHRREHVTVRKRYEAVRCDES